jgi:hypothetical protein
MAQSKTKSIGTANLTAGYEPEFARCIRQSVSGMAHFSGTGNGQACNVCEHYGFHEVIRNRAGDTVTSKHHRGCCAKFYELTGNVGGQIPFNTEGCKYFSPRPKGPKS